MHAPCGIFGESIPCDVRNRAGDKGSMRIYLIRHSMTKGNKEKRYIGTTDESLCLEGIQLLEERKGMYPEVTYVYVSPMKRCVQTAEIIYPEMMKAGAYSCNEKLRECDLACLKIIIISNFPAPGVSGMDRQWWKAAISGRGKQGSVHPADTGRVPGSRTGCAGT